MIFRWITVVAMMILVARVAGDTEREAVPGAVGRGFVESLLRESAVSPVPKGKEEWEGMKSRWMQRLREECFKGWPERASGAEVKKLFSVEKYGIALRALEFVSMGRPLVLYIAHKPGIKDPALVVLNLVDSKGWTDFLATMKPGFEKELGDQKLPEANPGSFKQHQGMFESFDWVMAYVAPTGVGPTQLGPERSGQRNLRFQASGHTIDSVRVWDARRAIQTLRSGGGMRGVPLWLQGSGRMAGVLTYASLFEPEITRLDLHNPPRSHKNGPFLFNILDIMDLPQAVAVALERSKVVIYQEGKGGWEYPAKVVRVLGWEKSLQLRASHIEE